MCCTCWLVVNLGGSSDGPSGMSFNYYSQDATTTICSQIKWPIIEPDKLEWDKLVDQKKENQSFIKKKKRKENQSPKL